MRWISMGISSLAVICLFSCGRQITEEEVQTGIREWWGSDEIDDVLVVAIYHKERNSVSFDARLVVSGDTLEGLSYGFRRTFEGWKVEKGPYNREVITEILKKIEIREIELLKKLKQYEEMLKGGMDKYASFTQGRYPARLDVRIGEISDYKGKESEYTIQDILKPFFDDEWIFIDGLGDTTEWFDEYSGKVIYFPLEIKGKTALEYTVKSALRDCFIDELLE
jgi:hypothetical protein